MKKIINKYKFLIIYITIFSILFLLKTNINKFIDIFNPFIFIIIDYILLLIFKKGIEKLDNKSIKEVIIHLSVIVSIFLSISVFIITNSITIIVKILLVHFIVIYMTKPMLVNEDVIRKIDDYLNENHKKFDSNKEKELKNNKTKKH